MKPTSTFGIYPKTLAIITVLLLGAVKVSAQNTPPWIESDVLNSTVGQQDHTLGVKVHNIEEDESGVKISLSVPAKVTEEELEEIVVYGKPITQSEPRPELKQLKQFEVINDLENGRSGIVIYLGKKEDFMLRFNYTDDTKDALSIPNNQ